MFKDDCGWNVADTVSALKWGTGECPCGAGQDSTGPVWQREQGEAAPLLCCPSFVPQPARLRLCPAPGAGASQGALPSSPPRVPRGSFSGRLQLWLHICPRPGLSPGFPSPTHLLLTTSCRGLGALQVPFEGSAFKSLAP